MRVKLELSLEVGLDILGVSRVRQEKAYRFDVCGHVSDTSVACQAVVCRSRESKIQLARGEAD